MEWLELVKTRFQFFLSGKLEIPGKQRAVFLGMAASRFLVRQSIDHLGAGSDCR